MLFIFVKIKYNKELSLSKYKIPQIAHIDWNTSFVTTRMIPAYRSLVVFLSISYTVFFFKWVRHGSKGRAFLRRFMSAHLIHDCLFTDWYFSPKKNMVNLLVVICFELAFKSLIRPLPCDFAPFYIYLVSISRFEPFPPHSYVMSLHLMSYRGKRENPEFIKNLTRSHF